MIPDGAIASGVISKIINDLTDVSKSKIKKAVEDKKNKHKNLESQLYNLIVSVLKELYDNSYDRNSDKIYDTAEKLLKGFIEYGKEDEDAVRYALKNILSCIDDDKCIEFKRLLIHEISKEEYNELYREIRLLQEEKEYRKTDRIEQKVDHLDQKLDDIRKNDEGIIRNTDNQIKFQNNKKQDYIDNWNSRLFLHIDNDERPITLADTFIMPHFEHKDRQKGRIKFSDNDTLDEIIDKFMKYDRSANMLISGVPGIGKTSIVSWIANEYKENDDIIILRFRDWERDELDDGLFKAICNTLECRKRDLENKTIILDGYDEIKVLNDGEILIKDFLNGILDFKNIKIIVTSRTDYIEGYLFGYIFNLKPFQSIEIKQFYNIITGIEFKNDLVLSNLDVLGIPVILYMAIMSGVDITKEATKPELYSKIFAEKGGIFDKFSYGGDGYDYGYQILRDSRNIKSYLGFLQEIAFRMFDEDKLLIPRKEDELPKLTFQGAEINVLEFPIKHLFDNTKANIEFVHKSIYEFFVAEYIIQNIKKVIESDNYKEKLAFFWGKTLKNGKLSLEIIEFMKYKISISSLKNSYDRVEAAFQLMLEDGMLYHTNMCHKKVIECEMAVFANMLEIIHLWSNKSFNSVGLIDYYIKYNRSRALNLSRMNLKGANLIQADLILADLVQADLRGADLTEADLRGADLRQADLRRADLEGANLTQANLSLADMSSADLRRSKLDNSIWLEYDIQKAISQLRKADFRCILLFEGIGRIKKINKKELFADEE